jgi:hypothetical protein
MNQYTGYITSQHQKPKFLAIVNGLTQPQDDIEQLILDLNINTATGKMLDILGGWIGQPRTLKVPLQIPTTQWDTLLYGGWDTGVWFNEFDTLTTIATLDDDDYRFLLILKIAQNHFDGTAATTYKILNLLGVKAVVVDNQNMSCNIVFVGDLTQVQQAITTQKIVNLAPFGVLVQYAKVNKKVVLWDTPPSDLIGGWDDGEFAENL